jgi:hypothetical protein
LDEAAQLGTRFGGGRLIDDTLSAGLLPRRASWSGTERNVGRTLQAAAAYLGIAVHIDA